LHAYDNHSFGWIYYRSCICDGNIFLVSTAEQVQELTAQFAAQLFDQEPRSNSGRNIRRRLNPTKAGSNLVRSSSKQMRMDINQQQHVKKLALLAPQSAWRFGIPVATQPTQATQPEPDASAPTTLTTAQSVPAVLLEDLSFDLWTSDDVEVSYNYCFRRVLPEGLYRNLVGYETMASRKPWGSKTASFMAAINQRATYSARMSSIAPTLTRGSMIYRTSPEPSQDRLACGLELFAMQCVPVPQLLPEDPDDSYYYDSSLSEFFASNCLAYHECQAVAGNGFNVVAYGSVFLFKLMTIRAKTEEHDDEESEHSEQADSVAEPEPEVGDTAQAAGPSGAGRAARASGSGRAARRSAAAGLADELFGSDSDGSATSVLADD